MKKFIYLFDEGNKDMKDLLGGKGANLAEMTHIGLPVPTGFTITTEACSEFYNQDKKIWDELKEEICENIKKLEEKTGKTFGYGENPLLVSVRSGAAVSMPGMMDTILNLGLNDITVESLAKITNNERLAWDSYRRFIQMFGDVVKEVPKYKFDIIMDKVKESKGITSDLDLDVDDLKLITKKFKDLYAEETGEDFYSDPMEQLVSAVKAVFNSWNNPRAIIYRELNEITGLPGTAVNVQSMVFGNMGTNSGTGVAFTRNPSTGENKIFGEYLMNAQGEDVVAGIRTPESIDKLAEEMPDMFNEFMNICHILEKHYKDMQDMEFTIERGKFYMLQTRNGKRTSKAAINIAVDMVEEGLITKEEAILRIDPKSIDQLLHKTFSKEGLKEAKEMGEGLAASPGAASGKVYFDCKAIKENGGGILVRVETSPEDIEGMNIADGILTVRGGMTSHAAVVARGMGKCCVCGCSELTINEEKRELESRGIIIKEGEYISLDGSSGKVYMGEVPKTEIELSGAFEKFINWVDEVRDLGVRMNADTPRDCATGLKFGAEGIGLCRTEHMFFGEERIWAVREMIVSNSRLERDRALAKIYPFQKKDFHDIFELMNGKPVTVRLLDPPLHEFLPKGEADQKKLAELMGKPFSSIQERISYLHEVNPMLGHRGCRLAITYPEIYEMQAKAIIDAALEVKEQGIDVKPEIMIPLVVEKNELKYVKERIKEAIEEVFAKKKTRIEYKVGTMVEVPRACLTADEIAEEAEFFSFGTNDLTQITFGFSRDDAGKFIKEYVDKNIFEKDPFISIDRNGVGQLMRMAIEKGRKTRPEIKLGICGEHGGEPRSVEFCNELGLNYVSCSPYRILIAKIAAAQGKIKQSK
ncbi:pyruvate, phosphate dikinase [Fusobacterium sp.]|uniref:pyruvate, phosphate dikinase n=1 Tax=Fusobacterium sp. TaxID=68766 RepID=UPI002601D209|nr:pyruvate, phosphate dikinase [Fusobacterium sp.]